ncbi:MULTISPECIES: phenylalanine--tRNA ligase subunit beta [unclassified Paracoccus (in: a-proteobacteria)]|uniref:phenylalanine--tRNA ligase subunit beta n=1 Tax=unclassified Paracoccus (in: a-proteobacteria) TaxID=2688777 RepID=UPI0012B3DAF8|nr:MULTISPECIES: phenylalanine--tRNA ligase subunit beta [unclassified Paracoccus (in: a-proteobacteria)]UXU76023.1 phenylalanine--tRNA ligase subunit beta [Paracoccus sp. SMMA_5]UXU81933.1 phenylalanine--tRNA ligase subunit beta [Paracoccus sp. SMMA_5_TC]
MKFTLSWLKEHLDTTASLDAITEALTDLGLEVEGVTDPAGKLQAFTLAKVIEAAPHPDADRLRVCKVLTDEGEKQIVCGAPNARAGITVVLAKPGDYVPGIDTTLGVGRIRGVESHGMMASERELELSDEHNGIIELPSGEVGQKFVDWLAANRPEAIDPVIEIKITPNRPDALGVHGIARDLAARGLGQLKPLAEVMVPGSFPAPVAVAIDPAVAEKAPFFSGRVIRGLRNGPSPEWLQKRLAAIGLRPINALVDITNYFTFDLNRPLHVFDVARLHGNLRIRPSVAGEELLALDGKTYAFAPGTMVIADDNGPESIAGIMGGEATGCDETTTEVFLESAYWDPIAIATTGRALKINSDARYRFERGVDPAFTRKGLELATRMILDLCGGEASDVVTAGAIPDTRRSYRLDPARVSSLVGMDIPEAEQRRTLEALGFRLEGDQAIVPSWRPDVLGSADLVEEVARIASLTRLQGQPLPRPQAGVPQPVLTPLQRREALARRMAASLGYNECVTYSFIDQAAATLFGGGGDAVRIENPISSEMTHMRPDLLPGLLAAAARNQARGFMDLALFECGPVFSGGEPGQQDLHLTAILVGASAARDPHGSRRKVDIYDAKADAEAILQAVGAPAKAQINRKLDGWWHPGRAGNIALGPNTLASFGEIHPRVLRHFGLKGTVVGLTLRLAAVPLPKTRSPSRPALQLSDLQAVERDFAFVVDAGVEALTLVNAAAGADKALIERVSVFDQFTGLEGGKKSIAITARLQPRDKTLTDAEIEAVCARIVDKVGKATGGVLRG